jgi:natural product precursor
MEVKKISLKGINEILSNNEMKNVKGGCGESVCPSNYPYPVRCTNGELRCYKTDGNSC